MRLSTCFAIVISAFISVEALCAAKPGGKPAWIESEPESRDSYYGIAHTSKSSLTVRADSDSLQAVSVAMPLLFTNSMYREDAQNEAMKRILSKLQLAVEQQSLFGYLFTKGLYTQSFDDVFISNMLKSDRFIMEGEYEENDDYWCCYRIGKDDFDTFMSELEDSVCMVADSIWRSGRAAMEMGQLYYAASSFALALETVHPMIFKTHIVRHDNQDVDLFRAIYDDYVNVYSGIVMSPSIPEIYVPAGESVPFELAMNLSRNGQPVSGMCVQTQYSGELESAPATDAKGDLKFRLLRASDEKEQSIVFSIDSEPLFDVRQTFASAQFVSQTMPEYSLKVNLFNPQILVYIDMDIPDSTAMSMLSEIVGGRQDMSLTSVADSADMVVTCSLDCTLDNPNVAKEKYSVSQYSADMSVRVSLKRTGETLCELGVSGFKLMATGTAGADRARKSAARQMCRGMKDGLAESFSAIRYDKRQAVWSEL